MHTEVVLRKDRRDGCDDDHVEDVQSFPVVHSRVNCWVVERLVVRFVLLGKYDEVLVVKLDLAFNIVGTEKLRHDDSYDHSEESAECNYLKDDWCQSPKPIGLLVEGQSLVWNERVADQSVDTFQDVAVPRGHKRKTHSEEHEAEQDG